MRQVDQQGKRPAPLQRASARAAPPGPAIRPLSPAPAPSPRFGLVAGGSGALGLPEPLKTNMETMSGLALDDVQVHRDSASPAAVGALAYARGNEIHLAPGEERHLPHEAWHVVQQKQGRVPATRSMRGMAVNADPALEQEAERMASGSASAKNSADPAPVTRSASARPVVQRVLDESQQPKPDQEVVNLEDPDVVWTIESISQGGSCTLVRGENRKFVASDDFNWAIRGREAAAYEDRDNKEMIKEAYGVLVWYTGPGHKLLNPVLSNIPEAQRKRGLPDHPHFSSNLNSLLDHVEEKGWTIDHLVALLELALHRLPEARIEPLGLPPEVVQGAAHLEGPQTLAFKGVDLEKDPNKNPPRYTLDDHRPGTSFAVSEFTSTSTNKPFAGRDSIIVYILPDRHPGKSVVTRSAHAAENEVLFGPGLSYTTEKRYDAGTPEFDSLLALYVEDENDRKGVRHLIFVRVHPVRWSLTGDQVMDDAPEPAAPSSSSATGSTGGASVSSRGY